MSKTTGARIIDSAVTCSLSVNYQAVYFKNEIVNFTEELAGNF